MHNFIKENLNPGSTQFQTCSLSVWSLRLWKLLKVVLAENKT